MKNQIVLQPYKITMSKHQLSAIELRILILSLIKLKEENFINKPKNKNEFDKVVVIKNADLAIANNYSNVKKALKSLRDRTIEVKTFNKEGKPATLICGLINSAKYSDDGTNIDIYFARELLPELLSLGKNYTKYGIEFAFNTQCKYAIRWYQLACHWKEKMVFRIAVEDIKELFKIPNNFYKEHNDFKRRILINPLKELKEKADVWLEISKTHKKGKNIVGYTFSVHKKSTGEIELYKEKRKEKIQESIIGSSKDFEKSNNNILKIEKFFSAIPFYKNNVDRINKLREKNKYWKKFYSNALNGDTKGYKEETIHHMLELIFSNNEKKSYVYGIFTKKMYAERGISPNEYEKNDIEYLLTYCKKSA